MHRPEISPEHPWTFFADRCFHDVHLLPPCAGAGVAGEMSTTKDTWYILKRHFSGGEVDFYTCAYPDRDRAVSITHAFGRTHKIGVIHPKDLKEIVFADKVVFRVGRPFGGWGSEPPADGSVIERGAVLELVLRSTQNDEEWDNLSQLRELATNEGAPGISGTELDHAKGISR